MRSYKMIRSAITVAALLSSANAIAVEDTMERFAVTSGCTTCHSLVSPEANNDSASKLPVAPSFPDISKRFHENKDSDYNELVRAIKYGTSPFRSHWKGKITGLAMPPNGEILSDYEVNKLLIWVLSLDNTRK